MARRKWALLNHNDAAVAATRLIVGACVQEVAFGPVSWSLFLTRSQDGSTREFGISSDSEISAHEDHFVDMERDLAAAMVLLHGLIGSVVREVQALGAMHYRIVQSRRAELDANALSGWLPRCKSDLDVSACWVGCSLVFGLCVQST